MLWDSSGSETPFSRLRRLDTPTLVLWGERGGWLAPEMGEELAAENPGARLRFVADSGHFAQEDNPAGFTGVIGDSLIEADYH